MKIFRATYSCFFAITLLLSISCYGQGAPDSVKSDIRGLIDGIQQAIATGSNAEQFFSPSVRMKHKSKIISLQNQGFLKFEISDYSMAALEMEDGQHASLPVTIKWSTRTEEASKSTTLHFVQEDGRWFLMDIDFWEVSIGWFAFPILALAIAYGVLAVVTYLHANRQSWADARKKALWQTLSIIPFAPFFYFHRKPWTTP